MGRVAEKEVIKLMNHPDHGVRNEARQLLQAYGTGADVLGQQMLAELNAPDAGRRRAAAEWLAQAQPDPAQQAAVVRALEGTLNDPDGATQAAAARALAAWATREQVPLLVKVVSHPSQDVRRAAISALGRLKDERGAEAVASRLSDIFDRREASQALQAMGPAAEKEVVKLLSHPDLGTRAEAKRILKVIGRNVSDLDQQLVSLKSPDANQRALAADWFTRAPVEEQRRAEVVRALEPCLRDSDGRVCVAAARALGIWGTRDNVPALIDLLNELANNRGAFPIRHAAMEALSKLKDERAVAPIAARLPDITDLQAAGAALQAFGPAAEPEVVKYLQPTFIPQTRIEACRLLSVIGTKMSLPALQAISTDRVPNVAASARLAMKLITDRGN
jgi:HEAT repeat protein